MLTFSVVAFALGVGALVFRTRLAHFFTYNNPFNPFKPRFMIPPAVLAAAGVLMLVTAFGGLVVALTLR